MSTSKTKLLTMSQSSPKLAKYQTYANKLTGERSERMSDNYIGAILYLASAVYDRRLCPNAGDCMNSCLIVHAGRGAIGGPNNTIQQARKRKSDWLLNDRIGFMNQLRKEISSLIKRAKQQNKQLVIRLNGGSDLDWTNIYNEFPNVQFWEYTKRPDLAIKLAKLPNVHVTYSHNERTTSRILASMVQNKINIAMVFNIRKGQALPANQGELPVIDGDLHDYRFLDPRGVIVGLRLKSLKRVDNTKLSGGFVMQTNIKV